MPATGAHGRSLGVPFSIVPATTSTVVSAQAGPAREADPGGRSSSMPKMIGITVTGTSMITVPATVGVRMRRNRDNRAEKASWKSAAAHNSVARSPEPPASSASTATAMAAPEVPVTRM